MIGRRSLVLMLLAVPLAIVGMAAAYVKLELAEPESFADRSLDALRSDEVRAVIAEQVAVELLERQSPRLVASRPVVLTAIEALLETDEFARVLRRAAVTAHGVLFRGDRDVIVELEHVRDVLVPALENASPELARNIPADLSPQVAEIRGSDAATVAVRVADAAKATAWPLIAIALLLLALAVWLAPDRRRATAAAALLVAGAAGIGLLAMAGLRAQTLSHSTQVGVLSDEDARAAAAAAWDALAGGLEDWLVITALAGFAVLAGGLIVELRVDRAAALRRASAVLAGGTPTRPASVLRGLGLVALGALVLLRVEPVFRAALILLGGALLLLGLAETLSNLGRARGSRRPTARRRLRPVLAAIAVALVAAAAGLVVLLGSGAPAPLAEEDIAACNGSRALCDRRLDQVVLAGTHNSMSAADRPGWFFANQTRPIPRQLRDGIRFLMIDPHYGIVDSRGRVRTDLAAEGTSRNRVARQIGLDAVEAAEGLAGRLGLVPTHGEREVFLCHTLCELGAERMGATLEEIRGFLERNRAEVLVVFIESSVDPGDVERAFERADLEPYLARLARAERLPTLREMIASGRRLVVLDEDDGGTATWYHPGFVFVEDTRIRALLRSPTACDPNRGTPDSPIFLMNHWIDRFPPPPIPNGEVTTRDALLARVRACRATRNRTPNLIAVDFYERGDLLTAVRELNARRIGT